MKPYYDDGRVTIYHGDCREVLPDITADVMVTDPPYGRNWRQGALHGSDGHPGIQGDDDTGARDAALATWGDRPAVMFGDLMLPPPAGARQVLVYQKPPNAGARGATAGFRRDVEAVYLIGKWPSGIGGRSSVIRTGELSAGGPSSPAGRYRHPHAKPIDVMGQLVDLTDGVIVDPFAGSGSTLHAAVLRGRRAIGIEVEERYCEIAATRLDQQVLDLGAAS